MSHNRHKCYTFHNADTFLWMMCFGILSIKHRYHSTQYLTVFYNNVIKAPSISNVDASGICYCPSCLNLSCRFSLRWTYHKSRLATSRGKLSLDVSLTIVINYMEWKQYPLWKAMAAQILIVTIWYNAGVVFSASTFWFTSITWIAYRRQRWSWEVNLSTTGHAHSNHLFIPTPRSMNPATDYGC